MFFGIALASWHRAPIPTLYNLHLSHMHVRHKHNTTVTSISEYTVLQATSSPQREPYIWLLVQSHAQLSDIMAGLRMRTGNRCASCNVMGVVSGQALLSQPLTFPATVEHRHFFLIGIAAVTGCDYYDTPTDKVLHFIRGVGLIKG
jgi:hypothetical protein